MQAGPFFSRMRSPRQRSLFLLQAAWFVFIVYSVIQLLWDWESGVENLRFDRQMEDAFTYFAALLTYFEFLRMVTIIQNILAVYYFLVGIFIFVRRHSDHIGILTSIALIGVPVSWGSIAFEGLFGIFLVLWVFAFSYLLFVFPNGKFLPEKLERWLVPMFAVFLLGALASQWNEWFFAIPLIGVGLLNVTGLASQAYRYLRVSTLSEKQQTKWVFFSILFLTFWTLFVGLNPGGDLRFEQRAIYGSFLLITGFVVVLMIPVAFTVSIFRYRLFDIDLIIRRTLQYTLLTGMLGGLYYGLVVGLQAGITAISGRTDSPFVTVASTLLIASLFNPLRHRLQDFINRRFYRKSYDAERLLQQFAKSARDEVDMDRLADSILVVAETAMQPEKVSLHIRTRQ